MRLPLFPQNKKMAGTSPAMTVNKSGGNHRRAGVYSAFGTLNFRRYAAGDNCVMRWNRRRKKAGSS
jgi:hypothetical protein